MFRTILCPIDFSAHSRQALRYAALLAARSHGRLIVLYVEDPILMNAAAAANYQAKELIASARKELARVVRRTIAPYGIPSDLLTQEVVVGKPHDKIRSTAEKFGCDLVVMGSHGLTGPGRLMFGSTTHRVLRRVEVPVLAIPPVKAGTPAPVRTWPGRWVMAPVDLGAKDKRDALNAALITDALGSELLLLHVVETDPSSLWRRLDLPRGNREPLMKTRAEARLGALRLRTEAAVVTTTRVVAGRAAAQIAAAAADRQIGLVIMTRRRGQGLFGPRQGSISYQVLCNAKTPVLALPSNHQWIRRAASRTRKAKRPVA
jgi:nucleotide-binding universal stress UspA family protein